MVNKASAIARIKSDINNELAVVKVGGIDGDEIKLFATMRRGDLYEPYYFIVEANKMMNDRYTSVLYTIMPEDDTKHIMFDLTQTEAMDLFNYMNSMRDTATNAENSATAAKFLSTTWNDNPHA